jgi:hypothetical protein
MYGVGDSIIQSQLTTYLTILNEDSLANKTTMIRESLLADRNASAEYLFCNKSNNYQPPSKDRLNSSFFEYLHSLMARLQQVYTVPNLHPHLLSIRDAIPDMTEFGAIKGDLVKFKLFYIDELLSLDAIV